MSSRCALLIGTSDVFDIDALLKEHGFQVETALSREEVAKVAIEKQFSLVFVYLDMAEMLDCIKRLRRTTNNRRTPLIGLINESQRHNYNEVACLKAGLSDYLALPAVPDRFELILRRWID